MLDDIKKIRMGRKASIWACAQRAWAGLIRRIFLTSSARRAGGSPEARNALGRRRDEMLRIHETAVKLVADLMPIVRQIERVDPDLASQMRRAVMSCPLNIAEGSGQAGKRETLHYRIAMGSAREAWSALVVAAAAGYVERPSDELTNTFNTVIGSLHRCIAPVRRAKRRMTNSE